jgi:cytidylate kinase
LAERLGFEFLDTGAMYRMVTLSALRAGIDLMDQNALARLLESMHMELPSGRFILNGEDVTEPIRRLEVTKASGAIADSRVVRQNLVEQQRRIASGRNMVCEGRDQGTIVFPGALCKFFLIADSLERARRRQKEMARRGENISLEEVLRAQEERDQRDAARNLAPMVPAGDSVIIDSTHRSKEEIVELMEAEVRRRMGESHTNA